MRRALAIESLIIVGRGQFTPADVGIILAPRRQYRLVARVRRADADRLLRCCIRRHAAIIPVAAGEPAAGHGLNDVDVTDTIDAGVASLREHRAYIKGLGGEFDPDEFLKNMAGYAGLGAGCKYAVAFHGYPMG